MDDLLNVAKQLDNINPKTPRGNGGRSASAKSGAPSKEPGRAPPEKRGFRGVSSVRVEAVLTRLQGKVDSRLLATMASMPVQNAAAEKRLELALLLKMRDSLARHAGEVPHDVSVCETLNDAVQDAEAALTQLQSGYRAWGLGVVSFLREQCSMAGALGCAPKGVRDELKALTSKLQQDSRDVPDDLPQQLMRCHEALRKAMAPFDQKRMVSLLHHTVAQA